MGYHADFPTLYEVFDHLLKIKVDFPFDFKTKAEFDFDQFSRNNMMDKIFKSE